MALCLSVMGVASARPGARQAAMCGQVRLPSSPPRTQLSTKHCDCDCTITAVCPSLFSPTERPSSVASCTNPR